MPKKHYPVDEVLDIPVNGDMQNIHIRSGKAGNPVLLFVHGGPGTCDRSWVMPTQSERLADSFTMVCWDQRMADPRNPMLIPLIELEEIYHFAAAHTDPHADTLLISCCGLNIMEIIDQLENRLGIPVINSNQCTLWAIGKYFGAHGPESKRLGMLFTK